MEVSFLWSWFSFFAGMGATVVLTIFLMVLVAIGQASKAKKKKSATPSAEDWMASIAEWQQKK